VAVVVAGAGVVVDALDVVALVAGATVVLVDCVGGAVVEADVLPAGELLGVSVAVVAVVDGAAGVVGFGADDVEPVVGVRLAALLGADVCTAATDDEAGSLVETVTAPASTPPAGSALPLADEDSALVPWPATVDGADDPGATAHTITANSPTPTPAASAATIRRWLAESGVVSAACSRS
jgi:hypothetical protein